MCVLVQQCELAHSDGDSDSGRMSFPRNCASMCALAALVGKFLITRAVMIRIWKNQARSGSDQ